MRKTIFALITAMILPIGTFADNYTKLWKQYDAAVKKDMPKSQIEVLDKIADQAAKEKSYGNLLNAEVKRINAIAAISPDSIPQAIAAFEKQSASAEVTDKALAAVYHCVLSDVYRTVTWQSTTFPNAEEKSKEYAKKALENPKLLASKSAGGYTPFVKEGTDSKIFNNDLLSIIGYKLQEYRLLNAYYDKAGNRTAALVTALEMVESENKSYGNRYATNKVKGSRYVERLDSLIALYGDLTECGEVAIRKYEYLNTCSDVTASEKADFIATATKRWTKYNNIPRLKSEYEALIQPCFNTTLKAMALPEKEDSIEVNVRNIKDLKIAISRLNLSGNTELNADNEDDWKKIKKLIIPSTTVEVNTPVILEHEYDQKNMIIAIPKLKAGLYVVEVSTDNPTLSTRRQIMAVSDMFMASLKLPEGKQRLVVVSATTGQPIPEAKIQLQYRDDTKSTVTTDSKGEAIVSTRKSDIEMMRAYTESDNYMQFTNAWGNFYYYGNDRKVSHVNIFTDRAIYRPGQTVHVSAVAYDINGVHSTKVVSGKELTFALYNANYKMVEEKKASTDDYGTASVDFNLPDGNILTGRFSVRCNGNGSGWQTILVEEYKRPTYEVSIDDINREYHNGDTVKVSGKAITYSGVPVQGAKVAYSVKRSEDRLFWRYSGNTESDQTLVVDTVATDANGKFEMLIPVVMPAGYEEQQSDDNVQRKYMWQKYFRFTATAQVTDYAGESHSAGTSLTLGTKATALTFDMPDKALKDSTLTITFKRMNASAKEIEGDVKYWFDNDKTYYTAKANEKITIDWSKMKAIESGKHMLWATCGTDTMCHEFVLFGIDDKRPATETPDWAYASTDVFPKDGKPVYIQVGSSCEDTHIFYSIIAGNKVIENGAYDVSNGIITTPLQYKEEYGEGILLNYLWVKNGTTYSHRYTIARPMQDKTLDMKWTTFRDKLSPGQKEIWTLNISRPVSNDIINKEYLDKEDRGCQLLAMMYDKSLDQITKNKFSFNLSMWQNLPSTKWSSMSLETMSYNSYKDIDWFEKKPLSLSTFNYSFDELQQACWTIGTANIDGIVTIAGYGKVNKAQKKLTSATPYSTERTINPNASATTKYKINAIENTDAGANNTEEDTENGSSALQIRENLNETAFFYPALYADKDGNVKISFTLPESVTTWNFRGFAHDRDMNYGMIESECVASKKVMVMPNMPRFVRNGDKATISARIANTTDKDIVTNVVMQMIDPLTDKVVYTKSMKIAVAANTTDNAVFYYSPDGNNDLLICKIYAEGKGYNDGEQHYLPVLPNTERVINTVPFTFTSKGEKNISMESIFPKDAMNKKLTVEYTANPTWMMIQALPYVAQTEEKNVVSQVSAYYANVLGKYIMNQSPVIKKVVELWKKEKKNGNESLLSALEKNQELKTLVLEETPWVMDADKRTDQKMMLSTFFDESAIDYRINSQFENIKKLQKEDGSWSWWQGMNGSPSMTAQVLETLSRLKVMTNDDKADLLINKGMTYLGNVVVKEYNDIVKANKAGQNLSICDSHAIQYLYINALLNRDLPKDEVAAKDYLLSYLRKDRQRNIYAKALMAVVLNKEGKKQEAKEYVESIKQYTVAKTDMGRYFDTRHAGYSWFDYRIPTQTAAIEAIKAVDADKNTIDEMRLWLLQSKRTQTWDTPINSVNAIYAFIDGNYKVLDTKNEGNLTIALDGKHQSLPEVSAGLGYTKAVYDINNQENLTITKADDNTSWGAAYAQFAQKVEHISDNASGIKVTREITGCNKQEAMKVGDKVTVRITITADRDYDFVQVVDKRAACMEPVSQTSGYHWGYYCTTKDCTTNYYFNQLSKGTHIVETEYYIDRTGDYTTGTCTAQCAYAPEFIGRTGAKVLNIK